MKYDLEKFGKIAEGWTNFVFKSKNVEELATVRAKICSTCPFIKEMTIPITKGDSIVEARGMYCSQCGCPISAKVRVVMENCGHTNPDERRW